MSADRVARIRALIEASLNPEHLDVIDESHMHIGHAGARDGRGHFRIRITCSGFAGKSRLARHRMVYAALDEMMATDIHALAIEEDS
ncbi:MAG TPA: BolA family protein [Wenzhouxiangellaceae bacterium]|nr:BolA family protein [Wenzhouxiangellaceae bacterium]